jgi:hypothetical protein
MEFLADFHVGTAPLDCVNKAFIALLPKNADLLTVNGFHPISLQNCIMKLSLLCSPRTSNLTMRLQAFIE